MTHRICDSRISGHILVLRQSYAMTSFRELNSALPKQTILSTAKFDQTTIMGCLERNFLVSHVREGALWPASELRVRKQHGHCVSGYGTLGDLRQPLGCLSSRRPRQLVTTGSPGTAEGSGCVRDAEGRSPSSHAGRNNNELRPFCLSIEAEAEVPPAKGTLLKLSVRCEGQEIHLFNK